MSIDTTFLRRCIGVLECAFAAMGAKRTGDEVACDVCRAACVKEYELALEHGGKLLRKRLAAYFASNRQVDRFTFKDLFRHAARHGLIEADTAERWLAYRDNRDDPTHDHGKVFAETTLKLLPAFIADAKALAEMIEAEAND